MFDEIFKRWINMEQLTENDIVPLFLEWNQTFGDGKGTAREVIALMNLVQTDYGRLANKILHDVGVAKGYKWEEVLDTRTGRLIARFFV
jgi:hypothetical protein